MLFLQNPTLQVIEIIFTVQKLPGRSDASGCNGDGLGEAQFARNSLLAEYTSTGDRHAEMLRADECDQYAVAYSKTNSHRQGPKSRRFFASGSVIDCTSFVIEFSFNGSFHSVQVLSNVNARHKIIRYVRTT